MVPRPAALPIGILMVGLGSVLLFVAFHNLPPGVATFGDFLGHLAEQFQAGGAK
jgi:hypothetical protein